MQSYGPNLPLLQLAIIKDLGNMLRPDFLL